MDREKQSMLTLIKAWAALLISDTADFKADKLSGIKKGIT